jgi:hypothetical protein
MGKRVELLGNIVLEAVSTIAAVPDQVLDNTELMCKTVLLNKEFEPSFNSKMAELQQEAEAILRKRGFVPMDGFTSSAEKAVVAAVTDLMEPAEAQANG